MPRNLRPLFMSFLFLLTLTVIGVAVYAKSLSEELDDKLKQKSLLSPTIYYADSGSFYIGQIYTPDEIIFKLNKLGYRKRTPEQPLSRGDYFVANNLKDCQISDTNLTEENLSCILFKNFSDDIIRKISISTNRIIEAINAELEPLTIAQYLGNEPVLMLQTPLGKLPPYCMNAVMAIEDAAFLDHKGISLTGISRALIKNITSGKYAQGGSTITQQLVKNYFLTSERTLKRKAQELALSLLIEYKWSKDEILETYLNIIYLGQSGAFQVRGYGAASQFYFSKKTENLNLEDCALLAAIVNSPGIYNPFKNPQKALTRRNLVLERMMSLKLISQREFEIAKNQSLNIKQPEFASETAPYYIDAVKKQLTKLNLDLNGKKIYTALNLDHQKFAQDAVTQHLSFLEENNKLIKNNKTKGLSLEGMLLSAHAQTGLVTAVVGGRSFKSTQFNRAIDGHRQVGSIMKPFVFLAALDTSEKTPTSILSDKPFTFKYANQKWSPENYENEYYGEIPLYFALKNSLNTATAKLGLDIGLNNIVTVARSLGVESKIEEVPALTLGAFELYPTEVLKSYLAISNMGLKKDISFVKKVTDLSNELVFEFKNTELQNIKPQSVAKLIGIMKQTINSGTARSIKLSGFDIPAAGKTGTTSDNKDAWFAGFTPTITTVAWVGYDKNEIHKLTGASGAIPIWLNFMKALAAHEPKEDFKWPEGVSIKTLSVDDQKSLGDQKASAPIELVY